MEQSFDIKKTHIEQRLDFGARRWPSSAGFVIDPFPAFQKDLVSPAGD